MKLKIISLLAMTFISVVMMPFAKAASELPEEGVVDDQFVIVGNQALYCGFMNFSGYEISHIPEVYVSRTGVSFPVVGFYDDSPSYAHSEHIMDYWPLSHCRVLYVPATFNITQREISFIQKFCKGVEEIRVEAPVSDFVQSPELSSCDGVVYSADGTKMRFIPYGCSEINEFPGTLTTIGSECGKGLKRIKSLTLPEGVEIIESSAFESSSLENIVLPSTLREVRDRAFFKSPISGSLELGNNVEKLGNNAFGSCNITSLKIGSAKQLGFGVFAGNSELLSCEFGNAVETLSKDMFTGCYKLSEVGTLPASIRYISKKAFSDCRKLAAFTVAESNPVFQSCEGIIYEKGLQRLYLAPPALEAYADLPETKEITDGAFALCRLASVDLSHVEKVGPRAFFGCVHLGDIKIGDSVTEIGEAAFKRGSNKSRTISISNSLAVLPDSVFADNKIAAISGGGNLREIGNAAFFGSNFTVAELDIPTGVEKIGEYAFASTGNVKKLVFGAKIKEIGRRAFAGYLGNGSQICPTEIYCEAEMPPYCRSAEMFSDECYASATLYVQTPEKYAATSPWSKFNNVVYHEYSRVEDVVDGGEDFSVSCSGGEMRVECADGTAVTIWSADGREAYNGTGSCTVALPRGIYIVRAGSSTHKVMM